MGFKTFSVNETLSSADANAYFVQHAVSVKSSTESVTSSATLQDDNHLFFTLSANETYWLDGILITDGAVSANIALSLNPPSGTVRWIADGLGGTATATVDIVNRNYKVGNTSYTLGTIASGTNTIIYIGGFVRVGSSGGTFMLQWAQGTSNGTATRVFANSFLRAARVRT